MTELDPARTLAGRLWGGKNPSMQITAHSSCAPSLQPRWHPNETNISAQQNQAGSYAWIQSADGNESRPPRFEAPSRKGPGEAHALVRRADPSGPRKAKRQPVPRLTTASGGQAGSPTSTPIVAFSKKRNAAGTKCLQFSFDRMAATSPGSGWRLARSTVG